MIEISNLNFSFDDKVVLKNVNFSVDDGTILGIVGINGAGKSTFLRIISGVYNAKNSKILFDGKSPLLAETRKNIFFLPDDPYYSSNSTPNSIFEMYKCFFEKIDREVFDNLLDAYQIERGKNMKNFSKGMRRQTFIALALAIKPKYLLLDEAFDGLDPLSRQIFKNAIIKLVEEENTTVLVSSHSLRELEDFCDKFILIDENTIKSHGDIAEHVSRLCKFELAFASEIPENLFDELPIISLDKRGRFATLVLEGDSEEMRAKLEALSPAIMDEMPINFEEAFIHDVAKNRGGTK